MRNREGDASPAVSGVCSVMKSTLASRSSSVVNQLDLQTARARRGKIRIVGDDPHPESDRAPAQFAADAAHANNAERLVVELYALEIFFDPNFRCERSRRLAEVCGPPRARSENACSAVETVFPPGAFNTMIPRRVAVSTSTLSTPTPARPTTRSSLRRVKISAVIFDLAAHNQPR